MEISIFENLNEFGARYSEILFASMTRIIHHIHILRKCVEHICTHTCRQTLSPACSYCTTTTSTWSSLLDSVIEIFPHCIRLLLRVQCCLAATVRRVPGALPYSHNPFTPLVYILLASLVYILLVPGQHSPPRALSSNFCTCSAGLLFCSCQFSLVLTRLHPRAGSWTLRVRVVLWKLHRESQSETKLRGRVRGDN